MAGENDSVMNMGKRGFRRGCFAAAFVFFVFGLLTFLLGWFRYGRIFFVSFAEFAAGIAAVAVGIFGAERQRRVMAGRLKDFSLCVDGP